MQLPGLFPSLVASLPAHGQRFMEQHAPAQKRTRLDFSDPILCPTSYTVCVLMMVLMASTCTMDQAVGGGVCIFYCD